MRPRNAWLLWNMQLPSLWQPLSLRMSKAEVEVAVTVALAVAVVSAALGLVMFAPGAFLIARVFSWSFDVTGPGVASHSMGTVGSPMASWSGMVAWWTRMVPTGERRVAPNGRANCPVRRGVVPLTALFTAG